MPRRHLHRKYHRRGSITAEFTSRATPLRLFDSTFPMAIPVAQFRAILRTGSATLTSDSQSQDIDKNKMIKEIRL